MLPPECEAGRYPVVVLRNVYTAAETAAPDHEQLFADLEMDMLQEVRAVVRWLAWSWHGTARHGTWLCRRLSLTHLPNTHPLPAPPTPPLGQCVRYGTVRRIVTPEGDYYEGAVAVVFEDTPGALACAKAMHGRFFDGRQVEVELQGRVEKEQVPDRVLPVSHPAAGLVSTEYVEEGEEFVDLAKEKARREEEAAAAAAKEEEEEEARKRQREQEETDKHEAEAAAGAKAEEVEAFFESLVGEG